MSGLYSILFAQRNWSRLSTVSKESAYRLRLLSSLCGPGRTTESPKSARQASSFFPPSTSAEAPQGVDMHVLRHQGLSGPESARRSVHASQLQLADAHSMPINMCKGDRNSAALCERDNHACWMAQCSHTSQSIANTWAMSLTS